MQNQGALIQCVCNIAISIQLQLYFMQRFVMIDQNQYLLLQYNHTNKQYLFLFVVNLSLSVCIYSQNSELIVYSSISLVY